MVKAQPLTLTLAREKMPFEIAPFFPYLTRIASEPAERVAAVSGTK
jgi:hypothetical protein